MLVWKIKLPSGTICFSCFTWSHLSLLVRAFAVSHLQSRGVWSNPWLYAQVELMLFLYLVDSKDRHKDFKRFLPEVFICIQQVWQRYFIFFLLHQCSALLMITHCQHKCLEKDWDFFTSLELTLITKKKYLANPLRALVLPRKIPRYKFCKSSTISHHIFLSSATVKILSN